MKPEKDNIKDIFSSKLKGFEPELPASIWDKIDADLPQPAPVSVSTPAKTATIYKYAAWVAGIAAVVMAVFLLMPSKPGNEELAVSTQPADISHKVPDVSGTGDLSENKSISEYSKAEAEKEIKQPVKPAPVAASNNIFSLSPKNNKFLNRQKLNPVLIADNLKESYSNIEKTEATKDKILQTSTDKVVEDIIPEAKLPAVSETENKQDAAIITEEKAVEKDLAKKIEAFEEEGKRAEKLLAENTAVPTRYSGSEYTDNSFELGVSGSSGFSKAKDIQNQTRLANADYLDSEASIGYGNTVVSMAKEQKMKLDHNQPVSFGISVSKKINDRVSLESGIVYTYLSSKVKSINNSDYNLKDSQIFHYLGIPLSVNYNFAEWNKLKFYISAGGLIQKDFYGRMKTSESVEGLLDSENVYKKSISQKKPQFSVSSSLGLSYPIYNKLSVYTNIGGAYYFDANNRYETIYSDKRWLFNLNLGLKFEF